MEPNNNHQWLTLLYFTLIQATETETEIDRNPKTSDANADADDTHT